jgi:RimJ/RimL family protein N-acetyltransferase
MFTPGITISEFASKKGKNIVLRLPYEDDVEQMLHYINTLSKEDTYISRSGEQLTLAEEQKYLDKALENLEKGNGFLLLAIHNNQQVGIADVTRMEGRSKHVGRLNISLAIEFREEGIGSEMISILSDLARKIGLQMLELIVYSVNERGIHVYTKSGFKEVGRIPKKALFHGELVEEVIMVKHL